jgi:hypothetical protein
MRNVPKELVTRGVSERVIDLFELVEVDHEQGHHAPVVDEKVVGGVAQACAVREAGKRIVL